MRSIATLLIIGTGYLAQAQTDYLSFFSAYEVESANTAIGENYLSEEEKNLFLYTNLARLYPKKFSEMYVAYCKNTNRVDMLKSNHYYKSLKTDLDNRAPAGALYPDKPMFKLAECWAVESGNLGIVGHDRKTCESGYYGENCSYGPTEGIHIIMQLLIDYGVESLGHRWNLLNSGYRGMGVAIRPHKGYRFCTVLDFTNTNDELRAAAVEAEKEQKIRQQESARKLEERIAEFGNRMAQWTDEEKLQADACRELTYLNETEKDFYFYINLMRINPKKFNELLWVDGPYFDFMPIELKESVHQKDGYKHVATYLKTATSQPVIVPTEKMILAGRCVAEGFRERRNNLLECLKGAGGYKVQSYFESEPYKDVMEAIMNQDVFNAVMKYNQTVVIEGGMRAMVR